MGYIKEGQEVHLFVRDTGIGISPNKQKEVFEAFRQEDESRSKRYGGTGLGLTLCKTLTEAMGGQIELQSQKHEGSTFIIRDRKSTRLNSSHVRISYAVFCLKKKKKKKKNK